jgi:hypothetical protein
MELEFSRQLSEKSSISNFMKILLVAELPHADIRTEEQADIVSIFRTRLKEKGAVPRPLLYIFMTCTGITVSFYPYNSHKPLKGSTFGRDIPLDSKIYCRSECSSVFTSKISAATILLLMTVNYFKKTEHSVHNKYCDNPTIKE